MIHRVVHPVVYKPQYLPASLNSGGGGGEVPVTPDEWVMLGIVSNTTEGGGVFTDSSGYRTITTEGDVVHSTTQKKYGASSIYFPGTSDLLLLPTFWGFLPSDWDFTASAWVYPTLSGGVQWIMSVGTLTTTTSCWRLYKNVNNKLEAIVVNTSKITYSLTSVNVLNMNAWNHVALIVYSGTTMLAVNGVIQPEQRIIGTYNSSSLELAISSRSDSYGAYEWNGYMDSIEISKGIARWTENFTPPTEPFTY